MTKGWKQPKQGKKRKAELLSAHNAVQKFLKQSGDAGSDNEDPRFQNTSSRPLSRKARRKQERKAKKARKNVYFSHKNGAPVMDMKKPELGVEAGQKTASNTPAMKQEDLMEKKKAITAKNRAKQKDKRKKLLENRRKQDLLEANQMEDRNIKRLEKSLRFRKKKKTKEVIIPGQFKFDGLDYLLDVVDSKKLEILKEADEDLAQEMDLEQIKDRQQKLASHLDGDSEEEFEGASDDSSEESDGNEEEEFDDEDDGSDIEGELEENIMDVEDEETKEDSDGEMQLNQPQDKKGHDEENLLDNAKRKKGRKLNANKEIDEDELMSSPEEPSPSDHRTEPKTDPYGFTPGEKGEAKSGSYVPPHRRAMMMGENMDSQRKAELEKLKRQLKGLINRLSSSNIVAISREIESLYQTKSRNDMNESLCSIIQDALIIDTMSVDRLVMEVVLLISILHYNVGSEVGAHFLQSIAVKFDELHKALSRHDTENKACDNALLILIHLYNFKIVHCCLLYDIIRRLIDSFTEQDIEMLLLILKSAGVSLRKDDPSALKEIILLIQGKAASSSEEFKQQSRVKYMLDTITALRNNDIRKMATNNNLEHLESLRKTLRNICKDRVHSTESNLRIPLQDLLSVDQKGRWWIVGSAWTGHGPNKPEENTPGPASTLPAIQMDDSMSEKILELSRQQRMNTDLRRSIFGIVMTAEDYQDCFNKLLHLGIKSKQEKECVLVVMDCCLQERSFNLYYAHVLSKLCLFERKFRIACQFAYWDRFKSLDQLTKAQLSNLSSLFSHLILTGACSLSVLKVIEFADMDRNTASFLKKVLSEVLKQSPEQVKTIFESISRKEKLGHLRETISLFLHHFILKQRGTRTEEEQDLLKEMITLADKSLKGDKSAVF